MVDSNTVHELHVNLVSLTQASHPTFWLMPRKNSIVEGFRRGLFLTLQDDFLVIEHHQKQKQIVGIFCICICQRCLLTAERRKSSHSSEGGRGRGNQKRTRQKKKKVFALVIVIEITNLRETPERHFQPDNAEL